MMMMKRHPGPSKLAAGSKAYLVQVVLAGAQGA